MRFRFPMFGASQQALVELGAQLSGNLWCNLLVPLPEEFRKQFFHLLGARVEPFTARQGRCMILYGAHRDGAGFVRTSLSCTPTSQPGSDPPNCTDVPLCEFLPGTAATLGIVDPVAVAVLKNPGFLASLQAPT